MSAVKPSTSSSTSHNVAPISKSPNDESCISQITKIALTIVAALAGFVFLPMRAAVLWSGCISGFAIYYFSTKEQSPPPPTTAQAQTVPPSSSSSSSLIPSSELSFAELYRTNPEQYKPTVYFGLLKGYRGLDTYYVSLTFRTEYIASKFLSAHQTKFDSYSSITPNFAKDSCIYIIPDELKRAEFDRIYKSLQEIFGKEIITPSIVATTKESFDSQKSASVSSSSSSSKSNASVSGELPFKPSQISVEEDLITLTFPTRDNAVTFLKQYRNDYEEVGTVHQGGPNNGHGEDPSSNVVQIQVHQAEDGVDPILDSFIPIFGSDVLDAIIE